MTAATLCALALSILPVRDRGHSAEVCLDVVQTARRAGVDPPLAVALAWGESRLRADAISPVGAVGPVQVLRRFWCAESWGDTECGLHALRELMDRHGVRAGLCRFKRGNGAPNDCWEARAVLRRAERIANN